MFRDAEKKQRHSKRVLVAMSGGVDSSVAAALLVEQGYEVVGATMQVWDYSQCDIVEGAGTCCSSVDVEDARSVADKINIPFYVINCETEFREKVIDPFINEYLKGSTPLPCVNCNTYLKFDHLIKKMEELECDYLATGHYAQIMEKDGYHFVTTSEDDWKDQTYFLFTLESKIIPKLLFPIGHLKKMDVRKIAEEKGLSVARKKDSTGICFVGDKGYGEFLNGQVSPAVLRSKEGVFKRFPSGQIMGQHKGIHHYTYGQSRGFGLDHHEKLFVVKVDASDNTVWLGNEEFLYGQQMVIRNVHTICPLNDNQDYRIKIRYQHKGANARIEKLGEHYLIKFEEKQRAITPGQAAVIYDGNKLVGGGWIEQSM